MDFAPYGDDNIFAPISECRFHGINFPVAEKSGDVSYSKNEINLCGMILPPPGADEVIEHSLPKEFYLPDDIPGEKVEEFFRETRSDFGMYRVIPTVNLDEKTFTLSEFDQNAVDKCYKEKMLTLGRSINMPNPITFSVPFEKKREKRLKDSWRFVQSQLEGVGLFINLNQAGCCMEVTSTTIASLVYISKAMDLLCLLATTSVPSFMALEIFEGSRQHKLINIGTQPNGLRSLSGITKDKFLKRWESLSSCLEGLSKRACCHIFLNENTFTAVSTTDGFADLFERLLKIVEECIVNGVHPETDAPEECDISDVHPETGIIDYPVDGECDISEVHPETGIIDCPIDGSEDPLSMLEAFALYTSIQKKQAKKLEASLLMVERSLYDYKISYTLNSADLSMAFSSIKSSNHPDVINNAGLLFELLSSTHVPASMAVEVLDGCLLGHIVKIGSQPGGLKSKHGIKDEVYIKRWKCLHFSLEALAEAGNCNVFLDENTVAVVCEKSHGLRLVEGFVQACIVRNQCPANAARIITTLRYGLESVEDFHVKHMEMETSGLFPDGSVKAAAFHMLLEKPLVNQMIEDCSCEGYSNVESCFNRHDMSFKLIEGDFSMLVSLSPKDGVDDTLIDRAWDFLQLLSSNVAVSKAIEVVDGTLYCSIIRTLYPPDVLHLKFGMTMECFEKRVRPRYESILKFLEECLNCEITNNEDCVAVVGHSPESIKRVRRIVLDSFMLLLGQAISMRPSKRQRAG